MRLSLANKCSDQLDQFPSFLLVLPGFIEQFMQERNQNASQPLAVQPATASSGTISPSTSQPPTAIAAAVVSDGAPPSHLMHQPTERVSTENIMAASRSFQSSASITRLAHRDTTRSGNANLFKAMSSAASINKERKDKKQQWKEGRIQLAATIWEIPRRAEGEVGGKMQQVWASSALG